MSNGQVDVLTGGRVNKLVARGDRVTDEQVRGVTERGEWAGDGKGVEWGWKGNGWGEWKACEGRSILS